MKKEASIQLNFTEPAGKPDIRGYENTLFNYLSQHDFNVKESIIRSDNGTIKGTYHPKSFEIPVAEFIINLDKGVYYTASKDKSALESKLMDIVLTAKVTETTRQYKEKNISNEAIMKIAKYPGRFS